MKIDDLTVYSSGLFDNLGEKEAELIYDGELILYEENTNFIHLSTDLRTYFEDKIQQRKESSNDTEWFKQNTFRFPQDNNDMIIAKYALEQEISKITILWTLCGLTCHSCHLRCLKNRDHEDDHDCLTDHQCHLTCQFTEAHVNSKLPICSAMKENMHVTKPIIHVRNHVILTKNGTVKDFAQKKLDTKISL